MRRFLAAQFAPVLRAWRNGYEAEVRRAAIAFFLLVFLAFGVCLAVPELRLGFSAYLQHLFQGMDLTDGAGNLSPLLLLANNLRACAVTMLYGLIPFVRLPALALGVNAVLLGGLAACYAAATERLDAALSRTEADMAARLAEVASDGGLCVALSDGGAVQAYALLDAQAGDAVEAAARSPELYAALLDALPAGCLAQLPPDAPRGARIPHLMAKALSAQAAFDPALAAARFIPEEY